MNTNEPALTAYLPIITVFLSGVFSLFVVLTANLILIRNQKSKDIAAAREKRLNEKQDFYLSIVDCIELVMKHRINNEQKDEGLTDKLQSLHSKVFLLEDEFFFKLYEETIAYLNVWQEINYEASPKRTGNLTLVSSTQKYFADDEKKSRKKLDDSVRQLIKLMRANLDKLK